ncbi:MAG: tRNA (adenine-N1)-methyltransferase [Streptosporangiaceae bacterium]|nr:tRNA (adenine-N1)-methyltransferase [Streptosporangiaceae bacterium]
MQARRGPLMPGEPVRLTDPKGRSHMMTLQAGASFHSHNGTVSHDDLIGAPDGTVARSSGGTPYVVFRPLLAEFTTAAKRGAAVVYPKDAAQIVTLADVFPGARVLEAGAGSGALSCWLLRAVGERGTVTSFERRPDFAQIARRNVEQFFGCLPPSWQLVVGEFGAGGAGLGGRTPQAPQGLADYDRVVLDMLAPWECADAAAAVLVPGGLACCYVATTTQLSRTVEAFRGHGGFDEPAAWETLMRGWHVDGLAVRPQHRMVAHTGFLITARRLAPGVVPPPRRRRPAKGARSEDE